LFPNYRLRQDLLALYPPFPLPLQLKKHSKKAYLTMKIKFKKNQKLPKKNPLRRKTLQKKDCSRTKVRKILASSLKANQRRKNKRRKKIFSTTMTKVFPCPQKNQPNNKKLYNLQKNK
jgi:hypothetical protein